MDLEIGETVREIIHWPGKDEYGSLIGTVLDKSMGLYKVRWHLFPEESSHWYPGRNLVRSDDV